uniref:L1 transposable element RRM domain-containing protein n=1 Tax=Oreochromis niloticus TaxID=8128 RepID=A0A669CKA4_ORENI
MRKRQTTRAQRAKDPLPEQQAKTTKKMDAYISRPQEDPAVATCVASGGELTLNELVAELKIIRTSTNNIEKDTKQIKTTVQEIEGKINALKQQLPTIQEEIENLRNHIEDLDNRGRRCNIRIIGIPELIEGEDMIKRSRREGEPPRPVMVNLLCYRDKEDILRAAREKGQILWRGLELREKGVECSLLFPATLEIKSLRITPPPRQLQIKNTLFTVIVYRQWYMLYIFNGYKQTYNFSFL